ncbi:MAG: beta-galactosidase [Patescibacteria group bacterium]
MDFLETFIPFIKKKREQKRRKKRLIHYAVVGVAVIGVLCSAAIIAYRLRNRIPDYIAQEWGVTFSKKYAEELGLNWKNAYLSTLDDLGARLLRIPAYWDEMEPSQGQYYFSDLDWMLMEADRRGAKVLLAVGRRLPRWPECHDPRWLRDADERRLNTQMNADNKYNLQTALLIYIRTVVERYRSHPAVVAWQVENEPFLSVFGICPSPDKTLLDEEINLVKSLDNRDVILTDSGELSDWIALSKRADILGVSLYRLVWNQYFGYFHWPLPSSYYRKKAELSLGRVKDVIITEVQLEPWTGEPILGVPISDQRRTFDQKRFHDTIEYAQETGLRQIYLWGVEWWYWMKMQGFPEYWEEAREVFHGKSQIPNPKSQN